MPHFLVGYRLVSHYNYGISVAAQLHMEGFTIVNPEQRLTVVLTLSRGGEEQTKKERHR